METSKLAGGKRLGLKRQDTPLMLKCIPKMPKAGAKRDEALGAMDETDEENEENEDVMETRKEVTTEETSEELDRVASKLGKMKHNSQDISVYGDTKKSS